MKSFRGAPALAFACVCATLALGCASVTAPTGTPGAGGSGSTLGGTAGITGAGGINIVGTAGSGQTGTCVNLQCQQDTCPRGACTRPPCANGGKTTVSGTVYDPAGKTPLYNVVVYVPNEPLAEIATGASCDTCSSPYSGRPIAATLTDSNGRFSLENMPVGDNIPLVIQVGKWRRAVTVPSVAACTDTPIDAALTHLPRNRGEGHIPKIAIANGGSDALNCLLKKIGIDVSEFTHESAAGRVNQYAGVNAPTLEVDGTTVVTGTSALWGSATAMKAYDIMLMSCEGDDNKGAGAASPAMRQAVKDFADAGGRVFGSHWHNAWVFEGPAPWPTVAKHSSGAHGFDADITMPIVTTFPKGMAFAEWMMNVGGSTTPGQIVIHGAEHSVDSTNPGAQSWIAGTDAENEKPMVQYFSFNTPVEAAPEQQCGRVVMSDLHVSAGNPSDSGKVPFPTGCTTSGLTPQEKALEFMLFDLSSCVMPDDKKPTIPDVGLIR
jgi:hypothetical protein